MCIGKLCGFNLSLTRDKIGCTGSDGSCAVARMMTTGAMPSSHPVRLKDASVEIQRILDDVIQNHNPGDGRQLAFLNVIDGVMLGWVNHDAVSAADIVGTPVSTLGIEPAPLDVQGA